VPSAIPQPVVAQLTRAAIFLVGTVNAGPEHDAAVRHSPLQPPRSDLIRVGGSRRWFLQTGLTGIAGLSLPTLLRCRTHAASASKSKSVILIWLDGGPSHMDLYDLKPDAPAEYRGIWKPIRSKVPGFDITELFPKQARVTDKFSIVEVPEEVAEQVIRALGKTTLRGQKVRVRRDKGYGTDR